MHLILKESLLMIDISLVLIGIISRISVSFVSKFVDLIILALICLNVFRFLGTPFFHSMVARSRSFASDIFVFMNPETVLLPGIVSTLSFIHQLDRDWLLVASPRNISNLPFHLSKDGKHWHRVDDKLVKTKEVKKTCPDSNMFFLLIIETLLCFISCRRLLIRRLRDQIPMIGE